MLLKSGEAKGSPKVAGDKEKETGTELRPPHLRSKDSLGAAPEPWGPLRNLTSSSQTQELPPHTLCFKPWASYWIFKKLQSP